jgi:type IV pilus assembly protein PilF
MTRRVTGIRRASRTSAWLLAAALSAGCAGLQPQASPDQRRAAEVNAELGINYLQQNDLPQAQRALDRALQFDPNLAMAHLGMGLLRESQGSEEVAVTHYRRALALEPGNLYVQANLGDLLCRRGDAQEAQALLAQPIASPSFSARDVALLSSGQCYARSGDRVRAEERMREVLRINPQFAAALYEMAVLTFADGRPLQTRAFLSRLTALGVATPASLLLCYKAEMQMGNRTDAQACAERLKREFGDSQEVSELLRMEQSGG